MTLLKDLLSLNEAKTWYGFHDGKWYVGQVTSVDGKPFSSVNTGPYQSKKEAETELASMKSRNAKGWAYSKVFQVKDSSIILSLD